MGKPKKQAPRKPDEREKFGINLHIKDVTIILKARSMNMDIVQRLISECQTPLFYHKFIIREAQSFDRNYILKSIMDFVYPSSFMAVHFTELTNTCFFLSRNCLDAIMKIISNKFMIPHKLEPQKPFKITIMANCIISEKVPVEDNTDIIKGVLSKRFKEEIRTLDLNNFSDDIDLNDYCPLFNKKIFQYIISQVILLAPKVLDLQNNYIKDISALKPLKPFVEYLDLGNNEIEDLETLSVLIEFTNLKTLVLNGNPLCEKYNSYNYVMDIKKYCKNVEMLDGINVANIEFRKNFICCEEASEFAAHFVEYFFSIYDSSDRVNLQFIYDPSAIFSVNSKIILGQKNSETVRLNHYGLSYPYSVFGSSEIMKMFQEFPKTCHDPYPTVCDITVYTETYAQIVISGIFKELQQVLTFNRSFYLKRCGQQFFITNEQLHVSNALDYQLGWSFRFPSDIQLTESPLPYFYEQYKLLEHLLHKLTTMNLEYCQKYLVYCNYDLKKALALFSELCINNEVPNEAFLNSLEVTNDVETPICAALQKKVSEQQNVITSKTVWEALNAERLQSSTEQPIINSTVYKLYRNPIAAPVNLNATSTTNSIPIYFADNPFNRNDENKTGMSSKRQYVATSRSFDNSTNSKRSKLAENKVSSGSSTKSSRFEDIDLKHKQIIGDAKKRKSEETKTRKNDRSTKRGKVENVKNSKYKQTTRNGKERRLKDTETSKFVEEYKSTNPKQTPTMPFKKISFTLSGQSTEKKQIMNPLLEHAAKMAKYKEMALQKISELQANKITNKSNASPDTLPQINVPFQHGTVGTMNTASYSNPEELIKNNITSSLSNKKVQQITNLFVHEASSSTYNSTTSKYSRSLVKVNLLPQSKTPPKKNSAPPPHIYEFQHSTAVQQFSKPLPPIENTKTSDKTTARAQLPQADPTLSQRSSKDFKQVLTGTQSEIKVNKKPLFNAKQEEITLKCNSSPSQQTTNSQNVDSSGSKLGENILSSLKVNTTATTRSSILQNLNSSDISKIRENLQKQKEKLMLLKSQLDAASDPNQATSSQINKNADSRNSENNQKPKGVHSRPENATEAIIPNLTQIDDFSKQQAREMIRQNLREEKEKLMELKALLDEKIKSQKLTNLKHNEVSNPPASQTITTDNNKNIYKDSNPDVPPNKISGKAAGCAIELKIAVAALPQDVGNEVSESSNKKRNRKNEPIWKNIKKIANNNKSTETETVTLNNGVKTNKASDPNSNEQSLNECQLKIIPHTVCKQPDFSKKLIIRLNSLPNMQQSKNEERKHPPSEPTEKIPDKNFDVGVEFMKNVQQTETFKKGMTLNLENKLQESQKMSDEVNSDVTVKSQSQNSSKETVPDIDLDKKKQIQFKNTSNSPSRSVDPIENKNVETCVRKCLEFTRNKTPNNDEKKENDYKNELKDLSHVLKRLKDQIHNENTKTDSEKYSDPEIKQRQTDLKAPNIHSTKSVVDTDIKQNISNLIKEDFFNVEKISPIKTIQSLNEMNKYTINTNEECSNKQDSLNLKDKVLPVTEKMNEITQFSNRFQDQIKSECSQTVNKIISLKCQEGPKETMKSDLDTGINIRKNLSGTYKKGSISQEDSESSKIPNKNMTSCNLLTVKEEEYEIELEKAKKSAKEDVPFLKLNLSDDEKEDELPLKLSDIWNDSDTND